MKSSRNQSEMAIECINIANSLKDKEIKSQSLSMLYVLLDKFGDEISKKKLKEMITLTEIGKMIRDEGIEQGKLKGKAELLIKQLIKNSPMDMQTK